MKNKIRSGRLACSFIIITSLLSILFSLCYIRSYAMPIEVKESNMIKEAQPVENTEQTKNTEQTEKAETTAPVSESAETAENTAEKETEVVVEEIEKTVYYIPSSFVNPVSGNTVRYKGGKTLERSSKITYGDAGVINELAEPDQDGFMKLNDRYLIAVGSRFNTAPGQYLDLVLENGVVIKCIMGDAKADRDTDPTNTFTYRSTCCSEFIIDKKTIRRDIYERGNASLKYFSWDSPVVSIVVYDDYYEL